MGGRLSVCRVCRRRCQGAPVVSRAGSWVVAGVTIQQRRRRRTGSDRVRAGAASSSYPARPLSALTAAVVLDGRAIHV